MSELCAAEPETPHSPLWWRLLWTSSETPGGRTAAPPWSPWRQLDSLNTLDSGHQLFTVSPAPRTGSSALQSVMKVPRTPQRGEPHSLALFIPRWPPPNPPSPSPSPCLRTPSLPVSSDASSSYSSGWQLTEARSCPLYLYVFGVWPFICSRQRLTEFPWLNWFKLTQKIGKS